MSSAVVQRTFTGLVPRLARWAFILVVILALEAATRGGAIGPLIMPPPSEIGQELIDLVPSNAFLGDLGRTLLTVFISFGIGALLGVVIGVVGWLSPLTGNILEPYLVTLYAMPTLVLYPVLLALMGVGIGPIVAIASLMVMIPVALNTMIALRAVPDVLIKLGRSCNCSRGQLYRKVLVPAATPLAVPGLRLGFTYAVIGTVAMEFVLADKGLGFRIGLDYREFELASMWALIVAVAAIAVVANATLSAIERRVRRDML